MNRYKQAIDDLEAFLKEKQQEVQKSTEGLTDLSIAKCKLAQLKKLSDIDWDNTVSIVAKLTNELGKAGDDLDTINYEVQHLQQLIADNLENLSQTVHNWNEYEALAAKVKEFLTRGESRLKCPDEDKQQLADEIAAFKPNIDQLSAISSDLTKSFNVSAVIENTAKLNSQYSVLAAAAMEAASKQDKLNALRSDYLAARNSFVEWLAAFEAKCSQDNANLSQLLEESTAMHQSESQRGQELFAAMQESSSKLIAFSPSDVIMQEEAEMKERMDKIIVAVKSILISVTNHLRLANSLLVTLKTKEKM